MKPAYETHVVVGDHDPEPRAEHIAFDRPVMLTPGSYSLDNGRSWSSITELYRRLTNGDDLAAIEGAAFHPLGDAERDRQAENLCRIGDAYHQRLGALHDMELAPGHVVRGSLMKLDGTEYNVEPKSWGGPRPSDTDQLSLYQFAMQDAPGVNQLTEAPVDSPICKCHDRMGNDFYFLPSGVCLFNVDECTDPARRKLKT